MHGAEVRGEMKENKINSSEMDLFCCRKTTESDNVPNRTIIIGR